MSGITGIFNLDGRPVDRALLQQMMNAIAHRGPDGVGCWSDGHVGFGHLMLHTTPESLRERQPLSREPGGLCLTLDGRVDNRRELRAALESKGYAPRANTDAELVLRAYECWGEDCPQRIIGDYAFAIWDGNNRKLFCARDAFGIRPFYYVLDRSAFTFSSELRPLLDTPGLQRKINLGMLGEYLCDSVASLEETLYQNVLRLPPAHRLILQEGAPRITRYWQIDPAHTIRYASDDEYAEQFFDIFRKAVQCQLRSQAPVALLLSGGLDSSSIFAMAAHLVREGQVPHGRIAAYHGAYARPEADERRFVDDLAGMWGGTIQVHSASVDEAAPAPPLAAQAERFQDLPDLPNTSSCEVLCTMAKQNGARVLMWGFGADEWLTGNPAHCADLLRRFEFKKLYKQLRHDIAAHKFLEEHVTTLDAARWCLLPLIPRALKSRIKRRLQWNVPGWITPAFSHAIGLQDRLLRDPGHPVFPTRAQQAMHGTLVSGIGALANELVNRFESHQGMEGRSPFCDRRLIEFAFALPEEQRWHNGETKYILRRAMRGHLPDSIQQRNTKGNFIHEFTDSLARESAGEAFRSLRLATDGYVDAGAVRKMHERCTQGDQTTAWSLWTILALERWIDNAGMLAAKPTFCD